MIEVQPVEVLSVVIYGFIAYLKLSSKIIFSSFMHVALGTKCNKWNHAADHSTLNHAWTGRGTLKSKCIGILEKKGLQIGSWRKIDQSEVRLSWEESFQMMCTRMKMIVKKKVPGSSLHYGWNQRLMKSFWKLKTLEASNWNDSNTPEEGLHDFSPKK